MLKKRFFIFFILAVISIIFVFSINQDNIIRVREEVDFLNEKIRLEGLDWQAGFTSMVLLGPEERRQRLGGFISTAGSFDEVPASSEPRAVPDSLDWRAKNSKNWLTSIKNQGNCGSCFIFGPVAVVEAIYKIESNQPGSNPDFSEQHLLSCANAGNCNNGGYADDVLSHMKHKGFSSESCYPYAASDRPCNPCSNWEADKIEIKDWSYITRYYEQRQAIFNALQDGPVVGGMMVYDDFYYYKSGIYKKVASANYEGGHIIAIVGYDKSHQYWICKNSWGPGWGESGYFRIAFGQVGIGEYVLKAWGVSVSSNRPPLFDPLAGQVIKEGDALSFSVKANDADNDPIAYGCANLPAGAALDTGSGLFAWEPTYSQAGIYPVTFTASDGKSSAKLDLHITVLNVKQGKKKF